MKINLELNEEEELILSEAFESAIAECFFTEIDEETKNDYFEKLQKLIRKFSLDVQVDSVIDELVELNTPSDEDFDNEIDIDEE